MIKWSNYLSQVCALAAILISPAVRADIGTLNGDVISYEGVLAACERNSGIDGAVDNLCNLALRTHGLTNEHIDYAYYVTLDGVELTRAFFPVWTRGHRASAVKLLETVVRIVDAAPGLRDRGATVLVRDLMNQAKAGTIVSQFRASDYNGSAGCIWNFVCQPIWWSKTANSSIPMRRSGLRRLMQSERGWLCAGARFAVARTQRLADAMF